MKWKILAAEYYDSDCQVAQEEYEYYNKKYHIDDY